MIWLIDDSGKTWPAETHPIFRWSAADRPISHAVWERGFVFLRTCGDAIAIYFNPRRTPRITLATTGYFISTRGPGRAALTHGSFVRQATEIFAWTGSAFRRMEELCAAAPHDRARIVRQVRRRVAWQSGENFRAEAGQLIEAWCESGRVWTEELYAKLCETHLLKMASVAFNPAGTSQLITSHWGDGLEFLSDPWSKIAIGKEVREQPFRELGRNVALLDHQTLKEDQPSRFDVSIILPAADGTPCQYSYERLLLPWRRGRDRYVVHTLLGVSRRPVAPTSGHFTLAVC